MSINLSVSLMDVLLFCTGLLFKEKFSGIKSCSKQKNYSFYSHEDKSLFNLNVLIINFQSVVLMLIQYFCLVLSSFEWNDKNYCKAFWAPVTTGNFSYYHMQILFILYNTVAGQVPFQLHVDSFFPITRIYFVYYFDLF